MNWIIEHLWLLILGAIAFAFFVSRRNASHRGARDDAPPGPVDRRLNDAAHAERTRRVREEIARKIAERRAAAADPTSVAAPTPPTLPPIHGSGMPPIDPFGGPVRRYGGRLADFFRKLRGK